MEIEQMSENSGERTPFISRFIRDWAVLSAYERLEQIVSLVLSFAITIVILVSLWLVFRNLFAAITSLGEAGIESKLTTIFGSITALLIAMEFNHTIFHSIVHRGQIVKVKTIVLIAILAIAREFILIENQNLSVIKIFGYAFSALCLGIIYYLIDVRDNEKKSGRPRFLSKRTDNPLDKK